MTFDLFGGRRLLLAGSRLGWFWIAAWAVGAGVALHPLPRGAAAYLAAGRTVLACSAAGGGRGAGCWRCSSRSRPASFRETLRGRVIVAVDVSESMATADPGRPIEERRGWRRRSGSSPGEPVENLSRREVARRLIEPNDAPIARLAREHAVEAFAFARETAPASLAALAEALRKPAPAGRPVDPDDRLAAGAGRGAEVGFRRWLGARRRPRDRRPSERAWRPVADRRSAGGPGRARVFRFDRLDRAPARRGGRGGQGARERLPGRRRDHRGDAQDRRLSPAAKSP